MTNGSGSGGGLTPEGGNGDPSGGGNGGPSGGGPNGPAVAGGGLPHSDTQGSLNSNVSYGSNDWSNAGGSDLINVRNILEDKGLTPQERNDKVLAAFAETQQKLIDAKKELARWKKVGTIQIGMAKEDIEIGMAKEDT